MSEPVFTRAVLASLLTHAVTVVAASLLLGLRGPVFPPPEVPIELVTVPPAPPAPAPAPPREVPKSKTVEPLTPPRLVAREPKPLAETPSPVEPPAPSVVDQPLPAPSVPMPLDETKDAARDREWRPGPQGAEAGAGKLGSAGDFAAAAGPGVGGGNGVAGGTGDGLGIPASLNPAGGGPLSLARPRGGYQKKPAYPESARRQGIGGVALLQFEVTANGRVGEIQVARSAGHPDLDRAAIEAVKQWRFEPARRGTQAVTTWVTLPVRFELR